MAQFETAVPTNRASLFDSKLWNVVARMLGCLVPIHEARPPPEAEDDRSPIEMDDNEGRREELKQGAYRHPKVEAQTLARPSIE